LPLCTTACTRLPQGQGFHVIGWGPVQLVELDPHGLVEPVRSTGAQNAERRTPLLSIERTRGGAHG